MQRKQDAARELVRGALEPIKQTLMTEVAKIQAEIRGGTEAIGKVRAYQHDQIKLLNDVMHELLQLEARVTRLEVTAKEGAVDH